MKTIYKLILKSYFGPMIMTFFIVMFVLLMNFMWRYIDELVGKGLSAGIIIELVGYALANMVPMGLPLSMLLAAIMTMGNLGENYELLDARDAVKFVVGREEDLTFMEARADEAGLWDRCQGLVSPVWGAIEPAEIAACLIERGLDRARLQLQLHKIIWPNETKGV